MGNELGGTDGSDEEVFAVGSADGTALLSVDGDALGVSLTLAVGWLEGTDDSDVGNELGWTDGTDEESVAVGSADGNAEGNKVGRTLG